MDNLDHLLDVQGLLHICGPLDTSTSASCLILRLPSVGPIRALLVRCLGTHPQTNDQVWEEEFYSLCLTLFSLCRRTWRAGPGSPAEGHQANRTPRQYAIQSWTSHGR